MCTALVKLVCAVRQIYRWHQQSADGVIAQPSSVDEHLLALLLRLNNPRCLTDDPCWQIVLWEHVDAESSAYPNDPATELGSMYGHAVTWWFDHNFTPRLTLHSQKL
jgi:hypothetical protein